MNKLRNHLIYLAIILAILLMLYPYINIISLRHIPWLSPERMEIPYVLSDYIWLFTPLVVCIFIWLSLRFAFRHIRRSAHDSILQETIQ